MALTLQSSPSARVAVEARVTPRSDGFFIDDANDAVSDGPSHWFHVVRSFIELLPDRTLRLDDEGYAGLASAGLPSYQASAAITGLRWRGEVKGTYDNTGVLSVRLLNDDEAVVPFRLPESADQVDRYAAKKAFKSRRRTALVEAQADKLFPHRELRPGEQYTLITEELMRKLATPKGGYRGSTIRMLGVPWPLPLAWRQAIVGRAIPLRRDELEAELRMNQQAIA